MVWHYMWTVQVTMAPSYSLFSSTSLKYSLLNHELLLHEEVLSLCASNCPNTPSHMLFGFFSIFTSRLPAHTNQQKMVGAHLPIQDCKLASTHTWGERRTGSRRALLLAEIHMWAHPLSLNKCTWMVCISTFHSSFCEFNNCIKYLVALYLCFLLQPDTYCFCI